MNPVSGSSGTVSVSVSGSVSGSGPSPVSVSVSGPLSGRVSTTTTTSTTTSTSTSTSTSRYYTSADGNRRTVATLPSATSKVAQKKSLIELIVEKKGLGDEYKDKWAKMGLDLNMGISGKG